MVDQTSKKRFGAAFSCLTPHSTLVLMTLLILTLPLRPIASVSEQAIHLWIVFFFTLRAITDICRPKKEIVVFNSAVKQNSFSVW